MRKKLIVAAAAAALLVVGGAAPALAATQTVTDVPAEPLIADDSSFGVPLTVTAPGVVSAVTIGVDFSTSSSETCAGSPWPDDPLFPGELSIDLVAPDGTSVQLVRGVGIDEVYATYLVSFASGPSVIRAQVLFDDNASRAVNESTNRLPESGTFRPEGSLASFVGIPAAGEWTLRFADLWAGDAHCYYGATLNVETVEAPNLVGSALADGVAGESYAASIAPESSDNIDSYELAEGAVLPAGLELDETTGEISGAPETAGEYSFDAIARNGAGPSAPATFTLRVADPAVDADAESDAATDADAESDADASTDADAGSAADADAATDADAGSATDADAGSATDADAATDADSASDADADADAAGTSDSGADAGTGADGTTTPRPAPALASTGAETFAPFAAALALLLAGAGVFALRRRSNG